MEATIELQFVAVSQKAHDVGVVEDDVWVEGKEGVRSSVVVDRRVHSHVETKSVQIPLMVILSIVFYFEEVAFPVFELLSPILLEAVARLVKSTIIQILLPTCGDKLVASLVEGSNRNYCYREHDQPHSHCRFLWKNKSRWKYRYTVDLISEVKKETTIAAQFSLTKRATVFSRGHELEYHETDHHHEEVWNEGKNAESKSSCDEFWFENDFTPDEFETVGAAHWYRTEY